MRVSSLVLAAFALLLLAGQVGYAKTTTVAYLNHAEGECDDYDPEKHRCGGGSDRNFALTSDLDGWFAADSRNREDGGVTRLVVVGSAQESESVLLDISFLENEYWLDLTGNECNGSDPQAVQVVADSGRPWHHFGSYFEIPSTAWEPAYDPARDRPINKVKWGFKAGESMVYRTPLFPEYKQKYGIRLMETSPSEDKDWRMSTERLAVAEFASADGAQEFSDRYKVPWYSMITSRKDGLDGNKRGTRVKTIWNHGDMYLRDGWIYWLPSDGAHPANFRSGNLPRRVIAMEVRTKGIRAEGCTGGFRAEGLHWSRMGRTYQFRDIPTAVITGGSYMYSHGESYYPINFARPKSGGKVVRNCVIDGGFYMLTRGIRRHRGDVFQIQDSDGCVVTDNTFFMAAAHGEGVFENTQHSLVLGNRIYFSFGKLAWEGSSDAWVALNESHFTMDPYCPEENVPAEMTPLLGGNGRCQAPGIWMDGSEDEKHPAFHLAGSNMYFLGNRMSGTSGWLHMGGTFARIHKTPLNADGKAKENLVSGNFYYRRVGGQRYAESPKALINPKRAKLYGGFGSVLNLVDDTFSKRRREAQIYDTRVENDLCVDPISYRLSAPPVASCLQVKLVVEPRTLNSRKLLFDSNMWVQSTPIGGRKRLSDMTAVPSGGKSPKPRSCAQFSRNEAVSRHKCETSPIKVRNFPDPQSTAVDLTITERHAGVDSGTAHTTLQSAVNDSNTITIGDYRGFPDPSRYAPHQWEFIADAYDAVLCGEPDCEDPRNSGWVPDGEYLPGGITDGAYFVQIGGTKTAYTALTRTGEGYEATLTLTRKITAEPGAMVHALPFGGSAPDRGPEFFP